MNCYLCGSKESRRYAKVGEHLLNQCARCRLVWLEGANKRMVESLYQEDDYHTEKGGSGFDIDGFVKSGMRDGLTRYYDKNRFKPLLREISRRRGDSQVRYLDVGCSAGLMLAIAREHGWSVEGVEAAPRAVELARDQLNLDVAQGTLETANLPARAFDAISLFHVVEHLLDPRASLKQVAGLMNDGGVLAIEVPNVTSLPARLRPKDWHGYVLPYHLWHFSPSTMTELLRQAGFRVIYRSTPYVPCAASHIVNLHQILSGAARRAINKKTGKSPLKPNEVLNTKSKSKSHNQLIKGDLARGVVEKAVRAFYWPADQLMAKAGVGEALYFLCEKES